MHKMLQLLRSKCYRKVSLAVQKDNYALSMYKKAGFQIIDENAEEFIMEYIFMWDKDETAELHQSFYFLKEQSKSFTLYYKDINSGRCVFLSMKIHIDIDERYTWLIIKRR